MFAQKNEVQTVDVVDIATTSYFEILADKDNDNKYLVKDVTKDYTTAIAGITAADAVQRPTTVVSVDGRTLRRFNTHVSAADA